MSWIVVVLLVGNVLVGTGCLAVGLALRRDLRTLYFRTTGWRWRDWESAWDDEFARRNREAAESVARSEAEARIGACRGRA